MVSKILSKTYLEEIRLISVWWILNKPKYTKLSRMTSCSDNRLDGFENMQLCVRFKNVKIIDHLGSKMYTTRVLTWKTYERS